MKMPTVLTLRKFVTKILSFKILFSAGVVTHKCNPSTYEVEAGG